MGYTEGYHAIADIYDKLNAEIDYEGWANMIEGCFDAFLPRRPELVLDLACGTGRMTEVLARRGYDMIGVDGSEEMLAIAYENAPAIAAAGHPQPMYLLQDMRSFELYGTVGAVVCCLDSVNYLCEDGDLEKCFRTVHNYLDPGGLFIFDVNSPYKFQNIYSDNAYILEDEIDGANVYCGWQNEYHEDTGICEFHLSVFRESEGGYAREDEDQRERCYDFDTIVNTLANCGLLARGCYSDYRYTTPTKTDERWYFVAQKV